jgi:hypothetical protein
MHGSESAFGDFEPATEILSRCNDQVQGQVRVAKGDLLMTGSSRGIRILIFVAILISGTFSILSFADSRIFTGIVGDAMCGAEHVMPGGDAACTRECISKGSKYALLVGDKVYRLDVKDKALMEALEKRAGKRVAVTGAESDNMITVTSVKAAK